MMIFCQTDRVQTVESGPYYSENVCLQVCTYFCSSRSTEINLKVVLILYVILCCVTLLQKFRRGSVRFGFKYYIYV